MLKADVTFAQENPPMDNWCDSGHFAPKLFRREGPDSTPEPTRFFRASGKGLNGIYCEPCLILVNYAAKAKRKIYKELDDILER